MRERLEAVSGSAALRLRPVLPGQGLTSEIRKNLPGRALLASRPLLNRQEHVVIQIYRGAHASDATTSRWHAGGLRLGRNLRAGAEGRQTERPSSSISDAAPHQLVRPSTSSLPQRSWTHKIEHRQALMPRGEVPHSDRCAPGATKRRGSPASFGVRGAHPRDLRRRRIARQEPRRCGPLAARWGCDGGRDCPSAALVLRADALVLADLSTSRHEVGTRRAPSRPSPVHNRCTSAREDGGRYASPRARRHGKNASRCS